jgi:hypothetical protein
MTAEHSADRSSATVRRRARRILIAFATSSLVAASVASVDLVAAKDHGPGAPQVIVTPAVTSDVSSKPLSGMAAASADVKDKKEKKKNSLPLVPSGSVPDPVVQGTPGTAAAPAPAVGFDGIGVGLGGYSPRWAPPDTNGAVGPNDYFEIVNADIAVFSKMGALRYGPVPTNTLWSGFGGGCESHDDGDGVVEYDRLADRWVITQFVNDGSNTECVAVSKSPDPTGFYARYAFTYPAFPDYPKLAVWPDAYYITFNLFGSNGFAGGMVCAYPRALMLAAAQNISQQCFNLGTSYGGLLPSDLDGNTPPPAGSPDFVLDFGSNRLNLWKFHVDWANPANTTLTGPTLLSVASFSSACGGGSCIPQPATSQKLGSLGDRLMSRLAYRNFGSHESLVVNHSVGTGFLNLGPTGVRWYELWNPGGAVAVHQQGTYAPDAIYRWMGSIAMDGSGNIALGYSASNGSVRPSVRYSGRLANDPLGQMTQSEVVLQTGTGSQLPNLDRWGDYSSLTIDPKDDCTFWYANEYLKADGTWNWSTHISSFTFPSCLPATQAPAITSANSTTFTTGTAGSFTVTATGAPTPTISASGTLPSGVSFVNNGNGTATLSGTPAPGTAGSYPLTINASNGIAPDTTQNFTLTVNAAAQALTVTTTSLPNGRRSIPYPSTTLQAANGTAPYSWRVMSGALPTGLGLSPGGVISGTPTKIGNFTFTVQVTDNSSQTASATLSIKISQH